MQLGAESPSATLHPPPTHTLRPRPLESPEGLTGQGTSQQDQTDEKFLFIFLSLFFTRSPKLELKMILRENLTPSTFSATFIKANKRQRLESVVPGSSKPSGDCYISTNKTHISFK